MFTNIPYDRQKAYEYARKWAYRRNPAFYDFSEIGGDCTNFASQCIYAGCGVMNPTRDVGWYYYTANDRSPSWTGVQYLYDFLTHNRQGGPFARETGPEEMQVGDIVQLGNAEGRYYHSQVVTYVNGAPSVENILVAAHTFDAFDRPLNTYDYFDVRFLHIEGARRWAAATS